MQVIGLFWNSCYKLISISRYAKKRKNFYKYLPQSVLFVLLIDDWRICFNFEANYFQDLNSPPDQRFKVIQFRKWLHFALSTSLCRSVELVSWLIGSTKKERSKFRCNPSEPPFAIDLPFRAVFFSAECVSSFQRCMCANSGSMCVILSKLSMETLSWASIGCLCLNFRVVHGKYNN